MVCPVDLLIQGVGKVDFTPANTNLCFDSTNVNAATDTIAFKYFHGFLSGDQVTASNANAAEDEGPGTLPTGLTSGSTYYVISTGEKSIQLAATLADAIAATPVPVTLTDGGSGIDNRITISEKFSARARSINLQPTITQTDATILGGEARYFGSDQINGSGSITFQVASDKRQNRIGKEQKGDLGDAFFEVYLDDEALAINQRKISFNAFVQPPQLTLTASATDNPPIEATTNFTITNYATERLFDVIFAAAPPGVPVALAAASPSTPTVDTGATTPLSVTVNDINGDPVESADVTFRITQGGGDLT